MDFSNVTWNDVLLVFGVCASISIVGAVTLLIISARQLKTLDIPDDADFFTTLQHLPITIPIALDLLDFAFDFFAAPIAWILLEMLGLQALQMITVFEGIIPGTQLIPTLTGAWAISRMVGDRTSTARDTMQDYNIHMIEEKKANRLRLQENYKRQDLLSGGDPFLVEGDVIEDDDDIIIVDND